MTKSYKDELFGDLDYDVFWEGTSSIPSLGGDVALEIGSLRGVKPTDIQRKLYTEFIAVCDGDLVNKMGSILLEHFLCLGYSVSESNLWDKLHDPIIFIPYGVENDPFVVVQWENEFDDEHGVQVVWREDGLMRVGIVGDDFD